jgi:hypothetical protein
MDLRNLPDAVANVMLGVAHELDETVIDHDLVNGSTVTGRAMRFVATGLVVGAMPWVALDVITGGLGRRERSESHQAEEATGRSEDSNPVWWEFLQK